MTLPSLLSIGSSALALVLSGVMFVQGGSNSALQTELQKRTQDIQAQQQEIQLQQQQAQVLQQKVDTARKLAEQLGPQVIGSLKIVAIRSNSAKIHALLAKHNVVTTDPEKEQIKKLIEDAEKAKATGGTPK